MIGVLFAFLPTVLPVALQAARPGELVLIGPFSIEELFKNSNDHSDLTAGLEDIEKSGGPKADEMLKAMKGWKVFILDRKVKEKDRWIWDRTPVKDRRQYPKILLDGKAVNTLKDKDGKKFPFHLEEWDDFTWHLDHERPNVVSNFSLAIYFKIQMREVEIPLKGGGSIIGDHFMFRAGGIKYDVNGKYELMKPKPQK
jgi:hypothetical protein